MIGKFGKRIDDRTDVSPELDLRQRLRVAYAMLLVSVMTVSMLVYKEVFVDDQWISLVPYQLDEPMRLSKNNPSPEQLYSMAWFVASNMVNVTPVNIDFNQKIVLRYVAPEDFGNMEKILADNKELVVKNNLSQLFEVRDYLVNPQNMTVVFNGTLRSWVSSQELPKKETAYKVSFRFNEAKQLKIRLAKEVPLKEKTT